MGAQTEVVHAGLPWQVANLLGQNRSAALIATGSTQADALPLTSSMNEFATVASNTGALLPSATGRSISTIVNGGANPLKVYPATGETINGGAANASFTVTNAKTAIFVPHLNTWHAILSA